MYKMFQFIVRLTCDLLLSFFAGIEIFENLIHLLQPWLVHLMVVFADHFNRRYMQESCSDMILLKMVTSVLTS